GHLFTLALADNRTLQVSFLSARCFRVRFNPTPGTDYAVETSPAVVTRTLGPVKLTILQNTPQALIVATDAMQVCIDRQPYRIRVFRGSQLISADEPVYNVIYRPEQRVIANFKTRPAGALYCGFGEKAGAQLAKNGFSMTQFNYDNFLYVNAPLPPDQQAGPLNPSEALYASIPFLIEINPQPQGEFAGPAYCYGLFFDNPAQSYFNMGSNEDSVMDGKYYFGALFGDLDYYFFLGDQVVDVLGQYTTLTGRGPQAPDYRGLMPPKYVFGYHQGCYGYYDSVQLLAVATAYRNSRIPCDGLHIDIDFQDNYRIFTHSELKFPNPKAMMDSLHGTGFKCSTNISPLLTSNSFDEQGQPTPYPPLQALLQSGGLLYDTRAGQASNSTLFVGSVSYGSNPGTNPYPYPPLALNPAGMTPLGTSGYYPDLGRAEVRALWGQQYAHLLNDIGIDMIWQDMTCPALAGPPEVVDPRLGPVRTFPLDLMIHNGVTYVPTAVCHNAYALFLLQGTWEGLTTLKPELRHFILARGGYAGMQRYAALWTGDTGSSWPFLRISLPMVLNLGLSGVPISGGDIGGFGNDSGCMPYANGTPGNGASPPYVVNGVIQGGVCQDELLIRWMQLGAFLPWYRNHYNGYTKQFQEPYRYGEPTLTHCRRYVELRYRLLQLYYDAMYEWTQTGMPIARALFLNDPDDPQVYDHLDDQFFVGKDILIAPILFQAESLPIPPVRAVYLPAGSQWYALKDNQAPLDVPLDGGQTLPEVRAGLEVVPIYIRAGAILPMRTLVEQYVGQLAQNPLEIVIYPGPNDAYTLYQDDGLTTQAATQNAYRTTRISHHAISGGTQVQLQRLHDSYTPPEPFYYVRLLATAPPTAVMIGLTPVFKMESVVSLAAAPCDAYCWDNALQATIIKVFDTAADVT
ncbi:MAG TPA: TIM-barrel domain-containing protein, partial [Candidatus Competibacteraceae bacterium]|nr:TIM-barrel domain-containing protein [Candidatus Competibacteraceae bacterium]